MERHIDRRRLLRIGVVGATTAAAAHPLMTHAAPFATAPAADGTPRIVDASASDDSLHVLVTTHGGHDVRSTALRRGQRQHLDDLPARRVDEAFTPVGFVTGTSALVGARGSQRRHTYETELRGELPEALQHLTETIPTSGTATIVDQVWEPASTSDAESQASRVETTTGTFGYVLAAAAPPGAGRSANSGQRMIVALGVPGEQVADVVRVALLQDGAIVRELPIGHHEVPVAAYADGQAAVVLVRDDTDETVSSVDLAEPAERPTRQPIGAATGTPRLGRWPSGLVITEPSNGGLRAQRRGHDGSWNTTPAPRGRASTTAESAAFPLDGPGDRVLITDGETITIEGN